MEAEAMSSPFMELLERIHSSDPQAIELMIEAYMPLVNRYSYVNGAFDEDCRQFLLMRLLLALGKLTTF